MNMKFSKNLIAMSCALALSVNAAEKPANGNPLIAVPQMNVSSSATAQSSTGTPAPFNFNANTNASSNASYATPTIDPQLQRLAMSQDQKKLQDEIEKLKTENQRLKETLGVEQTEIPAVSPDVITKNVPKYNVNGTGATAKYNGTAADSSNEITVNPGVNQLVQIAVGHTNRIITPFAHPQVSSATLTGGEQGEVMVKDNVVYISTNKTYPLSMFITEKGNENLAISLTLVPRKIPSREITVNFKDSNVSMRYASEDAEAWEKNQPFVTGTNKNLRLVALQEIPAGYNLSKLPRNYPLPKCRTEGFKVDFNQGQLLTGSKLHYVIGKVTNISSQTLEFKEASCGDYDVAAVALYPTNVLAPNQSSEIYVIKHVTGNAGPKQVRTSILDK